MKKTTFEKVMAHILDYTTIDELKENLKNSTPVELVKDGCFACYYSTAFDALKEFYGSDFDENRYINKDGSRKYKNGECYVWTIYVHNVAMGIEKLTK